MLKVKHLSKTIQNKKILTNVNFEIDRGKIGIFLGGSGAGKSTLLRTLNNLEEYDEGTFFLDGSKLNLASRNHTVGMVFQHFNLFEHLNVEDNIILTLTASTKTCQEEAEEIANRLLYRYDLQDHAKAKACNLSGGQKQRLAIARTLAVNPKIVCLDEPTSALDPRLTNQVATFIAELAAENRIVLLTTHDMHLLDKLEGQLFLMKNGSIAESTSKHEYASNPTLYPKLQSFLKGDT